MVGPPATRPGRDPGHRIRWHQGTQGLRGQQPGAGARRDAVSVPGRRCRWISRADVVERRSELERRRHGAIADPGRARLRHPAAGATAATGTAAAAGGTDGIVRRCAVVARRVKRVHDAGAFQRGAGIRGRAAQAHAAVGSGERCGAHGASGGQAPRPLPVPGPAVGQWSGDGNPAGLCLVRLSACPLHAGRQGAIHPRQGDGPGSARAVGGGHRGGGGCGRHTRFHLEVEPGLLGDRDGPDQHVRRQCDRGQ